MSKIDNEISNIQETFKEIRKSRGYTQNDISDDVVSRSIISKFENGTSMLSADKLFHAINNLNMTPNEFVSILNNFSPNRMDILYKKLSNIRFRSSKKFEDYEELIIDDANDKFEILSNIMIKSVLQDVSGIKYLSSKEKELAGDYLSGIDNWTEFEVRLLYYICPILDRGDRRWFSDIIIQKTKSFCSTYHERLFMVTLLNLYDSMLENNETDEANILRNRISKLNFGGDLVAIINFQILTDLHDYLIEKTKKNLIKAVAYLDKVEELGAKEIVEYSRNRLYKLTTPPPDVN